MPKGKQAIIDELEQHRWDWITRNTVGTLHVCMAANGTTSTREVFIVARYENEHSVEPDYYELYDGRVLLNPADPLWDYPTTETAKFFLNETYNWSNKTNG
tara:strand:- start:3372 stop:3674 length:303 start_codon:yes stop_codon:yes gene_type:complete